MVEEAVMTCVGVAVVTGVVEGVEGGAPDDELGGAVALAFDVVDDDDADESEPVVATAGEKRRRRGMKSILGCLSLNRCPAWFFRTSLINLEMHDFLYYVSVPGLTPPNSIPAATHRYPSSCNKLFNNLFLSFSLLKILMDSI